MDVLLRTMPLLITLDGVERWVNGFGPLGSRMTDQADYQELLREEEQKFADQRRRFVERGIDSYLGLDAQVASERDPLPTPESEDDFLARGRWRNGVFTNDF